MISDEERRRVAKALREPSELLNIRVPIYEVLDMQPDVAETLVSNEGIEHNNRRLLNRLADLIDRPTCSIKRGYQTTWGVCSRCGALVNAERAVSTAIEYLPTRYCPWCGKEIEND